MSTEDTGSGNGSVQEPSPTTKSGDESSLAARRARLRGSLSRQVTSPDPYMADQYSTGANTGAATAATTEMPTPAEPAAQFPTNGGWGQENSATDNGKPAQPAAPAVSFKGTSFFQQEQQAQAAAASPVNPANTSATTNPASTSTVGTNSWQDALGFSAQPAAEASSTQPVQTVEPAYEGHQSAPPAVPTTESPATKGKSLPTAGVMYEAWSQSRQGDIPETPQSPELEAELDRIAAAVDAANAKSLAQVASADRESASQSVNPVTVDDEAQESSNATQASPRTRKTAAQQAVPDNAEDASQLTEETPSTAVERPSTKKSALQTPSEKTEQSSSQTAGTAGSSGAGSGSSSRVSSSTLSTTSRSSSGTSAASNQQIDNRLQVQTVEVLNNIDQAMGACAMNLSALQKIATEQTETMKALAETMQHQNFFEIGLNLNSVIESMSAALEPMKAVGELVPAIDQLVVVLEARSDSSALHAQSKTERFTPEQLTMNLADQLGNGLIDPWTFKNAYMAIFPDEEPKELLQRLADLLGTQRMSGELFRTAYDAVKAEGEDEEENTSKRSVEPEVRTVVQVVQDEALVAELQRLRADNEELAARALSEAPQSDVRLEEMQSIVEQMQQKLEQRETEFTEIVGAKDREIQEAQELLTSRWEEFNARYDELMETLHKRDELLAEKESEVARKESENQQLKAQMEELRDQTKEMVGEMQKQFAAASRPKEEPAKQSGFFDPAPNSQQNQQQLFEPAQNRPLFQPGAQQQPADQALGGAMAAPQGQPAQQQQMQSQQMQNVAQQAPPLPAAPPVQQQQQLQQQQQQMNSGQTQTQAIPRPATTTPFLTGGSYGSGVRAQVFEVIVRQALAGAPWREICAGPMQVNNISPEEVEAEVKRRQALLGKK